MRITGLVAAIVAMFVCGTLSQRLPFTARAGPSVATAAGSSVAAGARSSAAASAPPVAMQVRVGFGGRCRPGAWAPLRVVLETTASRLDGSLRISVPGDGRFIGARAKTSYVSALTLPPHSTYEARLVIPIEERTGSLEAAVETGGAILASQAVDLARTCVDGSLVVTVLSGARRPPPGLTSAAAAFVTCEAASRDLPEDPLGYEGVVAVVLPLSCALRVSVAQVAALDSWTRQGGDLVLLGDAGTPLPLPPPLSDLVPVEIVGQAMMASFPSLSRRYGGDSVAQAPAVALAGHLKGEARAVVEDAGVPLLAAMRWGAGEITLMAFDPSSAPFCNWPGLARLWQEILPKAPEDRHVVFKDVVRSVLTTTRMFYPGVRPLLAFSAAYIATLLMVLVLLGRSVRFSYAPAAGICAAAALFSALAWHIVVPLAREATATVSYVTVIESENRSGIARVRMHVGVLAFSDEMADFTFQGTGWHMTGDCSTPSPGPGPEFEVTCGRASQTLRSLRLRAREMTIFHGDAVAPFALHAIFEKTQEGTTLAVRNDTGMHLEDASILAGEKAIYLGTIRDGEVKTCPLGEPSAFMDALSRTDLAGPGRPTGLGTRSQANLRQALVNELIVPWYVHRRRPDGTPIRADPPVLIAWAPWFGRGIIVSHLSAHETETVLVIVYLSDVDQSEVGLR
ncbi:MAG: hypothetical protein AB1700_12835 [Bacillota bacterium]